jgi:hypothetical protein
MTDREEEYKKYRKAYKSGNTIIRAYGKIVCMTDEERKAHWKEAVEQKKPWAMDIIRIMNEIHRDSNARMAVEERRSIKGYEGLYEIARSGWILINRTQKALHLKGEMYLDYVYLYKSGVKTRHDRLELWKEVFPDVDIKEFKRRWKSSGRLVEIKDYKWDD